MILNIWLFWKKLLVFKTKKEIKKENERPNLSKSATRITRKSF